MVDGQKYNLVLEALPGDFMPIDINLLVGNKYPWNFSTLETIDAWTKNYTVLEILNKIKETNIVPEKYFNGKLCIINSKKFRYKVISKESTLMLDKFFIDNINNKVMMNKVINIFQKYDKKCIDDFKEAINNQDIQLILSIIFNLSYEKVRNIYTYIEENIM